MSSDGVAGFKEILEEVYPKTNHQRCIVHIIRSLTKCAPRKEWNRSTKANWSYILNELIEMYDKRVENHLRL